MRLFFVVLNANLVSCPEEGLTDWHTLKQLDVERLGEADRSCIQNRLSLLTTDNMRHITLLEYFTNEL